MSKRDDSKQYAEEIIMALRVLRRTLPTGFGKEQTATLDEAMSGFFRLEEILARYIEQREQMK